MVWCTVAARELGRGVGSVAAGGRRWECFACGWRAFGLRACSLLLGYGFAYRVCSAMVLGGLGVVVVVRVGRGLVCLCVFGGFVHFCSLASVVGLLVPLLLLLSQASCLPEELRRRARDALQLASVPRRRHAAEQSRGAAGKVQPANVETSHVMPELRPLRVPAGARQ
jgi:hypothetical protein